jgi:hypothetical protein
LGSKDDDANLSAEVTSRLEALFGEEEDEEEESVAAVASEETREHPRAAKRASAIDDHGPESHEPVARGPIDNLKALVFSIDWEITDATMKAFLKEVKRLKKEYGDDRLSLMFLKLHESLGKYIKARKARANPEAIQLVASIHQKFEKMLTSPELSEGEKKRLLAREVKKYNRFKQQVLAEETAGARQRERQAVPEEPGQPAAAEPEVGAEPEQPAAVEPEPELTAEIPAEPEPGGPSAMEPELELTLETPAEPEPEVEPDPEASAAHAELSRESRELAEHIISEIRRTIQAEFRELRKLLSDARA